MKKIANIKRGNRMMFNKMDKATKIYEKENSSKVVTHHESQDKLSCNNNVENQGILFCYDTAGSIQNKLLQLKNGVEFKISDTFSLKKPKSKQGKQVGILGRGLQLGVIMIILLCYSSCARTNSFLGSSVVPAAKGSVKVKEDNNKNFVIHVEIKDLADVSRLQPPKESYVVWMETELGNTEKLGQLLSSKSFLSKQMTADLETVSSQKPRKIFVTAENDPDTQYPDRLIVLTTASF